MLAGRLRRTRLSLFDHDGGRRFRGFEIDDGHDGDARVRVKPVGRGRGWLSPRVNSGKRDQAT